MKTSLRFIGPAGRFQLNIETLLPESSWLNVICGWLRERWVSLKKEKRAVGKKLGSNWPGFQFHYYLWLCKPRNYDSAVVNFIT
jgi:hypothetical protein